MTRAVALVLLALPLLSSGTPQPQVLRGKVVGIADGDTIRVLVGTTQHRIRLEGIDAPEGGQAFGTKAKQALAKMVFGKVVKIEWKDRDRYKRILGHVHVDDRWINRQLVADGWAWHFTRYSKDKQLAAAEREAREAKRGLWVDKKPIAPWDYRKGGGRDCTKLYITRTGKSYHCEGCRYLAKSKIPITPAEARDRYRPCKMCKPPK